MAKGHSIWSLLLVTALLIGWGSTLRTRANGGPQILAGATAKQEAAFDVGVDQFTEVEHIADGLGPVMNEKACAACHSIGGVGGSSPNLTFSVVVHIARITRGQFDPMTEFGGSVLQRRSIKEEKGSLTVLGETIPKEATIVSFRQTPPLFGAGLLAAIRDDAILARADPFDRNHDGISGRPNFVRNPESGRVEIGRFGWKADLPTLHLFSGIAYLNEIGITSPTFPKDNLPSGKPMQPGWDTVADPEDDGGNITNFTDFMRFLAPLRPRFENDTTERGEKVFNAIGCASCHTPSMPAGDAPTKAFSGKAVPLYSDLLIHDMGSGLADGIVAEQAGGAEWRSAPLWGLSRRLFFLHDGRARSITAAIEAHGGEASGAKRNYQDVGAGDRNALLAFLGSL